MAEWKDVCKKGFKGISDILGSLLAIPFLLLFPLWLPLIVVGAFTAMVIALVLAIPCFVFLGPIWLFTWLVDKYLDKKIAKMKIDKCKDSK